MFTQGMFVFAVLSANIVISEVLVRHTFFRHLGTSLLVIIVTAVVANLGIIPTTAEQAPIYDGVFGYVAPVAIFLLLLNVNLKDVLQAGPKMILMFGIGAVGTMLGVALGMRLIDAANSIGEHYFALGGMFTATYIGGSVNFNAIALHYQVAKEGTLFAGAVAVDNIAGTTWMLCCLAIPKLMIPSQPVLASGNGPAALGEVITGIEDDTETVHPIDLGLLLGAAALTTWLSDLLAPVLHLPPILSLTTFALILAQFERVKNLTGTRLLGMYGLYLFLAVIGAFCDLAALHDIGDLGVALLILAGTILVIHGILSFGLGTIFKIDTDITAVASQACFGGPTSALAVARSLGRADLQVPGILVGALGYAVGTYLGFWMAEFVLK